MRAALLAGALLFGIGAGVAFAVLYKGGSRAPARFATPLSRPAATWGAGARRAPDFRLRDQHGKVVSLRSLRGRPVLVTFIDPVCQNLCPIEAKTLVKAAEQAGPSSGLTIVAVSVNPWGQSRKVLIGDVGEWGLPGSWRWAVGPHEVLAPLWRRYDIAVRIRRTRFRGVPVRSIDHTEASYLIDRNGYERALFVFPFAAGDVAKAVGRLD
jgi:cytochrome oxidase Cu insertion factor (SCO1/SenC/PrrC family)